MMKFLILLVCALQVYAAPKHGRIIGGIPAAAGQFPFVVAITKSTDNGNYFCAGALISNEWVLTAGQCVDEGVLFSIRVGSNSLSSNDVQRLATETFELHPQYNPLTLENDIGLIRFRLPIEFNNYALPVDVIADSSLPSGSSVVTTGWGQIDDEDAGLQDELNYVFLVTLSNAECSLTYGTAIVDTMVCVDGNFDEGTCQGDTGSPLVQYGSREITYLVGVASFFSGNGCESPDPSGFTRIAPYREWIRNVTNI